MNKLILALVVSLVLVFAVSYVSLAENMTVKAGYDLGGTVTGGAFSMNVDGGFSLGFEYTSEISDTLVVGGGLEYQLSRKVQVISGTGIGLSFIPLYGLVQYKFDQFYVIGRLGYDLLTVDNPVPGISYAGGIYYGVGAGYSINKNMGVEAVYGIHNMTATFSGSTDTGSYSKLGLSFGYKF